MLLLQLNFIFFYVKLLGVFSALWNGEGIFSIWTALCRGDQIGISTGFHFPSEDSPCGAEAVGTSACRGGMSFLGCSMAAQVSSFSWQNLGGFGELE